MTSVEVTKVIARAALERTSGFVLIYGDPERPNKLNAIAHTGDYRLEALAAAMADLINVWIEQGLLDSEETLAILRAKTGSTTGILRD